MTKRHVSSAWLAGAVMLLLGTFAAQAQGTKSCHPDGKPTESEVVFNSSGGSYGDAIQKGSSRHSSRNAASRCDT